MLPAPGDGVPVDDYAGSRFRWLQSPCTALRAPQGGRRITVTVQTTPGRRFEAAVHNRVLIVEDDHATETLLAAVMLHESIDCVNAADGLAALEHLERGEFSALLLDLLLPNMNGFEVLRHLRSTRPELLERTIVITAAAESTFKGCEELRLVRCVLRKPLDVSDLVVHVRDCFDNPKGSPHDHETHHRRSLSKEP